MTYVVVHIELVLMPNKHFAQYMQIFGTAVRLPHGFHAAKGSNVYIGIQHFPCDGLAPAILRSKEHKAEEPKENGNSFSEPSVSELSISPNPTNGVLRITASESLRSIVLYNLNGEKVLSATTEVLELYGLPCGMYILQAQTADGNR